MLLVFYSKYNHRETSKCVDWKEEREGGEREGEGKEKEIKFHFSVIQTLAHRPTERGWGEVGGGASD